MTRLLSTILFFLFFLSTRAQQKKPNIIWIVCEDISPFISAYGNKEIKTPNIDQLAKEGVRYNYVYTTAGVCAPSRSSIITGMYQTSIGTMHMRTIGDPKYQPVPSYSAVIPDYVKCFPEYLRKAGYYCTNNEKQDYQFIPPVTVWDENGPAASFRNRPKEKPFFSVFNLAITHESMLWIRKDSFLVDPEKLSVPPIYPNTITAKQGIARLFTNIEIMDKQVGELMQMLKEDRLYDNTIIFFYSDHGGALPWMKREILERGIHIPFVVRFPGKKNAGAINNDMVSSVDFAPTILSLAGINIPSYMQGQAFLGAQKSKTPRKYVFAGRDRMDTEYDRVRMVRDSRYRYIYNYMPEKKYYQDIEFRLSIPLMKEIIQYRDEHKLNAIQASWFKTKPVEELYDVETDPYELNNLVHDPLYADKLKEMRAAFQDWTKSVGDMASTPEAEMIKKMWKGNDQPPNTSEPVVQKVQGGLKISCETTGASIGYRIVKKDSPQQTKPHTIKTWDFGLLYGTVKNGNQITPAPAWNIYNGEIITLSTGDTLKVNAMRIGYKAATIDYFDEKK